MKLVVVLTFVSMAVMLGMFLQTLRQELHLRHLNTRTVEHVAEFKKGEKTIASLKSQISALKTNLASVTDRVDELKKHKAAVEQEEQTHRENLLTCGKEKERTESNKKATIESINRFKDDHAEKQQKAEKQLQHLKQQILDRDKAVCIFADPSFAEVRSLCGIDA
ncbi:uncharacterized protein LOC144073553 [Stigmatopora argus]